MTTMTSALPMTPARRRVLAIGVPIAIALIGWTGFGFVADLGQASYTVGDSIPLRAGHLRLNTGGGDITVRPGGRAGLGRLTGTVRYSLIRPRFSWNPAADSITANVSCAIPVGFCGLEATLEAPAQTAVSLSSNGGNLSVSGMTGNVTLSSGGGDLSLTGLPGDLVLATDGGNIDGNALTAQDVSARSAGGNITLTFTRPPRNVRITTDGGNVTVILPSGSTAYNIHAATGGGNVADPVPQSPSSLHVITVTTGGGNISITQAS
jgi:putative adhesin